jgi:hypothetical protein
MKNKFKIFEILFITILVFSCSNESEVSQKDLTQGYWELNLMNDASKQNIGNKIYFQFDNNELNVYIQVYENSSPHLIDKYPALIQKSEIVLYHPLKKNEIISNIRIDKDGNFLEKNVEYIESNFSDLFNKDSKTVAAKGWLCDICITACEFYHAGLGLSHLDVICCPLCDTNPE